LVSRKERLMSIEGETAAEGGTPTCITRFDGVRRQRSAWGVGRAGLDKACRGTPWLKPKTVGAILTRRARSDLRPCIWG